MVHSTNVVNIKVSAIFLFNWMKFSYDSDRSIFLCIHIHTSRQTYIIFSFGAFTFLLQFLFEVKLFVAVTIIVIKAVSCVLCVYTDTNVWFVHINLLKCMIIRLVIIVIIVVILLFIIVGHNFHCFFYLFHHRCEHKGKCNCLIWLNTIIILFKSFHVFGAFLFIL